MKKIALLLAVLMIIAAAPAWCLIGTVDTYVDDHTKNSGYRPVQDAGELYGAVNHGIGTGMDKVPVLKERSRIMGPLDTMAKETVKGAKFILNGTWDILTFKSMREKK